MKTSDIYWGAIPWVVLQLILVAILIFWPQSVTYWIDSGPGDRSVHDQDRAPLPDLPPPPPLQIDPPR